MAAFLSRLTSLCLCSKIHQQAERATKKKRFHFCWWHSSRSTWPVWGSLPCLTAPSGNQLRQMSCSLEEGGPRLLCRELPSMLRWESRALLTGWVLWRLQREDPGRGSPPARCGSAFCGHHQKDTAEEELVAVLEKRGSLWDVLRTAGVRTFHLDVVVWKTKCRQAPAICYGSGPCEEKEADIKGKYSPHTVVSSCSTLTFGSEKHNYIKFSVIVP